MDFAGKSRAIPPIAGLSKTRLTDDARADRAFVRKRAYMRENARNRSAHVAIAEIASVAFGRLE